ncbi:MAG: hypothetical protein CL613_06110 [Aquimarina sp.]|nr:hypothetical protein [Aquimarina sp.]
MKPLIILVITFILACLYTRFFLKKPDLKLAARIAMAVMLVFTAIGHFIFTHGMSVMVPDFIPLKKEVVLLTGVLEILLAVGILVPSFRVIFGWALIAFLIVVLPANIKAALESIDYQTGQFNGPSIQYLWFRIPLQVLFIIWTYFSTIK